MNPVRGSTPSGNLCKSPGAAVSRSPKSSSTGSGGFQAAEPSQNPNEPQFEPKRVCYCTAERYGRKALGSVRLGQTQSNPVKPNSECLPRFTGRSAEWGSGAPYRLRAAPAQSDSIRLLLSHPRGLRQEEDRICRNHRLACVSRSTLDASRFTPLILSVFPFVYLAFLAGHPIHVFTKRTQMSNSKYRICNGLQNKTMRCTTKRTQMKGKVKGERRKAE